MISQAKTEHNAKHVMEQIQQLKDASEKHTCLQDEKEVPTFKRWMEKICSKVLFKSYSFTSLISQML